MSVVMIWKKDRIQNPIYYVSWILRDAETQNSKLEKLVYALSLPLKSSNHISSSQYHFTDQSAHKSILHRLKTYRHVTKWAIELSKFDIKFNPWLLVKDQVLVNFLVKCTILDELPMPEEMEHSAPTPNP